MKGFHAPNSRHTLPGRLQQVDNPIQDAHQPAISIRRGILRQPLTFQGDRAQNLIGGASVKRRRWSWKWLIADLGAFRCAEDFANPDGRTWSGRCLPGLRRHGKFRPAAVHCQTLSSIAQTTRGLLDQERARPDSDVPRFRREVQNVGFKPATSDPSALGRISADEHIAIFEPIGDRSPQQLPPVPFGFNDRTQGDARVMPAACPSPM